MSNARRAKRRTVAVPARTPPTGSAGAVIADLPRGALTIGTILGMRHRIAEMAAATGDYGGRGVLTRAALRESAVGEAAIAVQTPKMRKAMAVGAWLAGGWAAGVETE